MTISHHYSQRAFTFIEVLACLLVLSLGIASAVGVVAYGANLSSLAQSRTSATSTAISAAYDATPLPTDEAWAAYTPGAGTAEGYLNGYYVVREEAAAEEVTPGIYASHIDVDVFETFRGRLVASYSTRILRQQLPDPTP
jgi:prepilin-type N-terminal cleavage/methylation domain-containing protein